MADIGELEHARLAPSGYEYGWRYCPGKPNAEARYPDRETPEAELGTAGHAVAHYELDASAPKPTTRQIRLVESDESTRASVTEYVEICREEMASGDPVFLEIRLPIEFLTDEPGAKGTADFVRLDLANKVLKVKDYKNGLGVLVSAYENGQLGIYAAAAVRHFAHIFKPETVEVEIIQPRRENYSSFTWSIAELTDFALQVREDAAKTYAPDAPRIPGAKPCEFCRAKVDCPELLEYVREKTIARFPDLDNPEERPEVFARLTPAELSDLAEATPVIRGFCNAIDDAIERRLLNREVIPGWKLISGRAGNRKWKNEGDVEATLKRLKVKKADSHTNELKGPAQIEKILGRARFAEKMADLITRSEGRPKVARADDPHPAIDLSTGFTDLDQEV